MTKKILNPVIGALGHLFSECYTHSEIDRLFLYAGAPDANFGGNKVNKSVDWLRLVNREHNAPLDVLGILLEDIMERELFDTSECADWDNPAEPDWSKSLRTGREKVVNLLQGASLVYQNGGLVATAGSSATKTLLEQISSKGLSSVDVEVQRALKMVSDDPNGAAQFAANVLEATFKSYLNDTKIWYDEDQDTLKSLWGKVRDQIGINPKNLEDKDLQKVAAGLFSIIDGTMHFRNKRSSAHGRGQEHASHAAIRPRHARLLIHASHTLAVYILECGQEA